MAGRIVMMQRRVAASLLASGLLCGSAAPAMPAATLTTPWTLDDLAARGLCLLDECDPVSPLGSLTAEQLKSLEQAQSPWLTALAVLCGDTECPPVLSTEGEHATATPVLLSYEQLKAALNSEHPPVRAMALLRLDLGSPAARQAAEALLHDDSRLSPRSVTVADHAYARLHPDIEVRQIGESRKSKPRQTSSWTPALRAYAGLPGLMALREAEAEVDPQWRERLRRFDAKAEAKGNRAVLAGLRRTDDLKVLRQALGHPALEVRLTAFDALLLRDPTLRPAETALRLLRRGGAQRIDGCVPMAMTIAVALLTALERSQFVEAPLEFLLRLPAENSVPEGRSSSYRSYFSPRHEIATHLAERPAAAARYQRALRRWVDEGLPQLEAPMPASDSSRAHRGISAVELGEVARVLAGLNDASDLSRLKRFAALGMFGALGRRDDAVLRDQAAAYARRGCLDEALPCHAVLPHEDGQWHRYALALPAEHALRLLKPVLSRTLPPAVRAANIGLLLRAQDFREPPDPILLRSLWNDHQILLPHWYEQALENEDGRQALALLRDRPWLSLYWRDAPSKSQTHCSDYARVVGALFVRVAATDRDALLARAFNSEPICSLEDYVRAYQVPQGARLPERSWYLPEVRLSMELIGALSARAKRATGEDRKTLNELHEKLMRAAERTKH